MKQKNEVSGTPPPRGESALKKYRDRMQMLTRWLITAVLGLVALFSLTVALFNRQTSLYHHVLVLDSALLEKHVELQEAEEKVDSLEVVVLVDSLEEVGVSK